jgi:hypothetical protein
LGRSATAGAEEELEEANCDELNEGLDVAAEAEDGAEGDSDGPMEDDSSAGEEEPLLALSDDHSELEAADQTEEEEAEQTEAPQATSDMSTLLSFIGSEDA